MKTITNYIFTAQNRETMKKYRHLIIPVFFSSLLFSCDKEQSSDESFPDVPFVISIYVVDSLQNHVFPENGMSSSIYQPSDFYAYSQFSENIGEFNANTEYGHVFWIKESSYRIRNNASLWNVDSTLTFYFCFDDLCDSVTVYKPNISQNSAQYVLLQGDTTYNFIRDILPYEINE